MAANASPVALVTGCSSGIGRATALLLARSGFRVFATVRTDASEASLLVDARGLPLEILRLDVRDEAAVSRVVREVLDRAGRIDVLVNNAGFAQLGAIEDLSRDVLRQQLEVNVVGAMHLSREVLPAMRAQGGGTIVNVSSIAGRVSVPFIGAYCASKFALEALSDAMRLEARPYGVRVVLVEPGPVATKFGDAVRWSRSVLPPDSIYGPFYEEIVAEPGSPRAASPDRVAYVILKAARASKPRARYRIRLSEGFLARLIRVIPAGAMDWGIARWYGLSRHTGESRQQRQEAP